MRCSLVPPFRDLEVQDVRSKTQLKYSHVLCFKVEQKQVLSSATDSPNLPSGTRVSVTLVARLLLTPVAKMLCWSERSIFMSRTCVCEISGSHCGEYEDDSLLGYGAV
jgi:hypothetical protein